MKNLDQLYLDYVKSTEELFQKFELLEIIRYSLFKDLIIDRKKMGIRKRMKSFLRPLKSLYNSNSNYKKYDIILCVESDREVITDIVMPIYNHLKKIGSSVGVILDREKVGSKENFMILDRKYNYFVPNWSGEAYNTLKVAMETKTQPDHSLFQEYCKQITDLASSVNYMLDIVQPKVIVTVSRTMPISAAITVLGKKKKIRTIELQHGIPQAFYTPLISDNFISWGQISKNILTELGEDPSKIFNLGSPRHDDLTSSLKSKNEIFKELNLKKIPTLVFFSNGNDLSRNGNAPIECAYWINDLSRKFYNRMNIIVKLHPNEDGQLYVNNSDITILKNEYSSAELLNICNYSASYCSTVMYESILFEKPVIQFYDSNWPDLADNWKSGLAIRASSIDNLNEIFDKVLKNDLKLSVNNEMINKLFQNVGNSISKVANHIIKEFN